MLNKNSIINKNGKNIFIIFIYISTTVYKYKKINQSIQNIFCKIKNLLIK